MCQELSESVAEGVRMCQEFPGVVRAYQELLAFVRGCKEFSGCARSCQKCQELECVEKNAVISKSLLGLSKVSF